VETVRVGVVGVGALGRHHARVYAKLPGAKLAGVVDVHPGRAEEVARACGTEAASDYRGLLGRVDAVSVATPTTMHADIGEAFLDAGVHVLVEKPISRTLEDADRLIRAAARNGRVLQVGHVERFNPAVRAVREIVRRPRFFEAHRMGVFAPRSLDIDVVLDLMIHDLDIIRLLVPSAPARVEAVGIAILTDRIDIANARIEFADGAVANVTASRVSMEKIRKLRLFQPQEYISLDYGLQQVAVFSLAGAAAALSSASAASHARGSSPEGAGAEDPFADVARAIVGRTLRPERVEPLEAELGAFVEAARGRGPVECSGEDGRRALDLALEVLEKAERAQAREFDRT
jgi:predicted dehydrogenase